jgi:putative SOS response-associated peptidase YedK
MVRGRPDEAEPRTAEPEGAIKRADEAEPRTAEPEGAINMCGRYVSVSSPTILAERFGVAEVRLEATEPNYNVTPRADVPVVAESQDARVLDVVRWGLIPSWAKDTKIGDRLINARSDKILTSNAYKRAFERRRCIVPADGFYEWQVVAQSTNSRGKKKVKQPWFFRRRDGEPLAFAGCWEIWHDPELGDDAPRMKSCVIITTDANDVVQPIHDRMPVVLPESAWDEWLDRENRDVASLHKLLVPAAADVMEAWPVSLAVNKPDNNGPELLERAPLDSLL